MDKDSTIVREAAKEMDRQLKQVMPDSWYGHARFKIECAEALTGKQRTFAMKLSERLLETGKVEDAERAASISIKKAQEKF